jgi:replication factor A1
MIDMNETFVDSQESIQFKNSNEDIASRAAAIQKLLTENGADVPFDEIESKLKQMTDVFKVPATEAQRSVMNAFLKKYNISKTKAFAKAGAAETKKISEISAMAGMPDTWVNVTGKVIQIWEKNHESIAQVGLIGDETGVIKFTIWSNSETELLELNQTYDLKNAVVKSWNDKASITLNKASAAAISKEAIVVIKSNESNTGEIKDRTNEIRTVSELQQGGLWTDLKANIVQIFEQTHESIAFAGVLGDETGTMRFTVWKTSDIEELDAGKSYLFKNAITKEWNGMFSIEINRIGKIEEIDEEIIAIPSAFELCGCAVDIQAGSGLIRRCPECNKVMSKGTCAEHGKVKGKYDLRIKAVFDDGLKAHETIINCELTEKLLSLTLEDAVMTATETLDPECINDIIKAELIGKYFIVRGAKTDRYIIAENVERADFADMNKAFWLNELVSEELEALSQFSCDASDAEMKTESEVKADALNSDFEEFEKMLNSMDSNAELDKDFEIEVDEIEMDEIKVI